MLISVISYAQVGLGTQNPQGTLHIDSAKDNPATGQPSVLQQKNDVIITETGKIGIGTTDPKTTLHIKGYITVGTQEDETGITPLNGMIRFNTITTKFEGYSDGNWVGLH